MRRLIPAAALLLSLAAVHPVSAQPPEPTAHEQYLVELVNRARADPLAEARRYNIDLNEGVEGQRISPEPKPPLAVNPQLLAAARQHSRWMLETGTFSHSGENDSTPQQRMERAGYRFERPWIQGENLGSFGTTGELDMTEAVQEIHKTLFVDEDYPGRGHRVIMLNPQLRELGAGLAKGGFRGMSTAMATQNFAASGHQLFLTGAAYRDDVRQDGFYSPGEGLGGVRIEARRTSDGRRFTTTTWASGGYALPVPPGTYELTASDGPLAEPVRRTGVTVKDRNVKVDFIPAPATQPADAASAAPGR